MSDDRGAATVVAAAMVAALVLLLATVLVLGAVVATRHRAAVAADLAALAGAAEGVRGQRAGCDRARSLAASNGGELRSCEWQGWNLQVVVASTCGCLPVGGTATVRARAGPVVNVMG
ncbi:Rv3654c family TadE-like protein [Actinomycetospora chiangmaiensis]|uniref:Rv3654c family TadE-like protein n=1 Tax=Actinomycetospora chiangmaiensis TaxID=402650 RepID=UPI0003779DA6|nr:Rv3654c family TadE-like protein [Actinomycetospora chiangmaiensis]